MPDDDLLDWTDALTSAQIDDLCDLYGEITSAISRFTDRTDRKGSHLIAVTLMLQIHSISDSQRRRGSPVPVDEFVDILSTVTKRLRETGRIRSVSIQ